MLLHKVLGALIALSALTCSLCFSTPTGAKLVKLEITWKQDYGTFRPGAFVHWEGRVVGELHPTEAIPDLGKATRNERGLVEYSAKVSLLMPADPTKGNGALLVDIPNRGRPYAEALYNSPRDEPFRAGTFDVGTGFLQDEGFSVAPYNGSLGKAPSYPPSPMPTAPRCTSKASALQWYATLPISWPMARPTGAARPIPYTA